MHRHLLRQQWCVLRTAQAYDVLQTTSESLVNHPVTAITAKQLIFSQDAPVRRTAKTWTYMVEVWRRHWLRPSLGLCNHLVAQKRCHKGQRIPNAEQGRGVEVDHQALCGGHPQMPAAARQGWS